MHDDSGNGDGYGSGYGDGYGSGSGYGLGDGDITRCVPSPVRVVVVVGAEAMIENPAETVIAAPFVYLASPYRGDVERNIAYARACLADSLRRGEVPVMPHLLYPQVLDDADPKQREIGIAAAMDLLRACRWLVVYQDLGISSGMRAEIDLWEARKVNQPLMPPVQYRSLGGAWNAR